MIGPPGEARQALTGVVEMLVGKEGFQARFDASAGGVARSFQAALYAVPLSAFAALCQRTLAERSAGSLDGALEPYSTAFALARFVADWSYFPLFAAFIATLLRRRSAVGPWIVVTNWAHLIVVTAETAPLALLVMGAPEAGAALIVAVAGATVYAHVLAARAALEMSWFIAIPAGCASVATMLLLDVGLMRLLN